MKGICGASNLPQEFKVSSRELTRTYNKGEGGGVTGEMDLMSLWNPWKSSTKEDENKTKRVGHKGKLRRGNLRLLSTRMG